MDKIGAAPPGHHTFMYKFPNDAPLEVENILKFIKGAVAGEEKEYFES